MTQPDISHRLKQQQQQHQHQHQQQIKDQQAKDIPSRQQQQPNLRSSISVARLHRESLAMGGQQHHQQHQRPLASQRFSLATSTSSRNLGSRSHSLSISAASSARPAGISLLNSVRSPHMRAAIANNAPHLHRSSLAPIAQSNLRHTIGPASGTHLHHRAIGPANSSASLESPLPLPPLLADQARKPALPAEFVDSFVAFHARTETFALILQHGLGVAKDNYMQGVQALVKMDTAARETITHLRSKLVALRTQRAAALSLRTHHTTVRTELQSDLASLHTSTQALRADRTGLSSRVAQLESRLASLRHALIDRKSANLEMQRRTKVEINQYVKLLGLSISVLPLGNGILFAFDHVLAPPRLAKLRIKHTVVGGWEVAECVPGLPSGDLDRWMAEFAKSGDTRTLVRRVRSAWLDLVEMGGGAVMNGGDAMGTIR